MTKKIYKLTGRGGRLGLGPLLAVEPLSGTSTPAEGLIGPPPASSKPFEIPAATFCHHEHYFQH